MENLAPGSSPALLRGLGTGAGGVGKAESLETFLASGLGQSREGSPGEQGFQALLHLPGTVHRASSLRLEGSEASRGLARARFPAVSWYWLQTGIK